MHVNYIRIERAQHCFEVSCPWKGPNCLSRRVGPRNVAKSLVLAQKQLDDVPLFCKHCCLGFHHRVFTTILLIAVMDNKNLHGLVRIMCKVEDYGAVSECKSWRRRQRDTSLALHLAGSSNEQRVTKSLR